MRTSTTITISSGSRKGLKTSNDEEEDPIMIADDRKSKQDKKAKAREARVSYAKSLKIQGYSNTAIAKKLSISESSVRYLLRSTD